MTKETRISVDDKAAEIPERVSLIERADMSFGLDPIDRAARSSRRARPNEPDESPVALTGPTHAIDRDALRAAGLIVPEDRSSETLEEFRIVKRELLSEARRAGTAKARRIMISSPHPGEGKTYCAANLAIALAAARETQVLLVDCDLARQSVSRRFGLPEAPGLIDALRDDAVLPETLALETDIEGLFVMPAGEGTARDAELLSSKRTPEVLDRLTRGAPDRFIILDTPPALAASPAADLAAHVGQSVLIARADTTGRAALEDALHLLSACACVKLLLNATRFSPSGRRFGSYGGVRD